MEINIIKSVKIALIIVIMIFTLAIVIKKINTKTEVKIDYELTNENINLQNIIDSSYYFPSPFRKEKVKYTMLYLYPTSLCSLCMGQYDIYVRYFATLKNKEEVNQVLAVIDTVKKDCQLFSRVNHLEVDAIGISNSSTITKLTKYKAGFSERQLLIIDNTKKKIIMKIKIDTGIQLDFNATKKEMDSIMAIYL